MADIKTITHELTISGSLSDISSSLADSEIREDSQELKSIYLLKLKIDELITEVNILKNN